MHAIHAYILKKDDLISDDIKFINLDVEGLIMTVLEPKTKNASLFIEIETDYFGGAGEQHCWSHSNSVVNELDSINEGLRLLGVIKKDDLDGFDTVGLGKYRSIRDIFPEDFIQSSDYDENDDEFHKTKPFVAYPSEKVVEILAFYIQEQESKDPNSMGLTSEEAERAAESWLVKNVEGFTK